MVTTDSTAAVAASGPGSILPAEQSVPGIPRYVFNLMYSLDGQVFVALDIKL